MILRGSKSGIAWLTGQIPLHAPQEKQLFRYSPPLTSVTSAGKPLFISLLVTVIGTPSRLYWLSFPGVQEIASTALTIQVTADLNQIPKAKDAT